MTQYANTPSEETSEFDIKKILRLVLKNWYWYVIFLICCFSFSWIYLRYTPSVYTVKSTLLIKDDKPRIGGNEPFLEGLDFFASSRNVQNEIELVRSFDNIKQTITELNLDISYFAQGNIKTGELYDLSPFKIKLDTNSVQPKKKPIYIKVLTDSTFSLYTHDENVKDATTFESSSNQIFKFGEHCHTSEYSFIVNKTTFFTTVISKKNDYYFVINDVEELTYEYLSNLKIELADKKSSILILTINSLLPKKENDFLNKLCEVYIESGLREKNQIAVNTIYFIDDQLNQITDSLQGAENRLEKFRSSEKIMDLGSSATNAFIQLEQLEKEHAALIVKDRYYNYLLDYLSYNYDIKKIIAPSAMGIQDIQLNNLIAELHNLNSEKTSLSFSAQNENPAVHILELKVESTKKALIETLKNILKASEIALQDNENRLKRIQVLVNKLPSNERSLVNIQRRFLLNENIYNYLMQKRIEAGIAKAANIADNRIINKAMINKTPVSPKKPLVILISIMIGLIIPSTVLYLKSSFNDTITNKDIITQHTKASVIGSVAHYNGTGQLPILSVPKSGVSESIRSLRINLQYLAADKTNKVIGITSTISGEGKTFFSSNLAASIAMSRAKVIIVGADLRKPKLNEVFEISNDIGLSNYYINKATANEIIRKTIIPNLDIITSGPIPPNPTELLESNKTDELFTFLLKEYEYIIIDAPPVGLVADYYILSKHIDADLYLIRQNHTPKTILKDLNTIHLDKKLRNLFIVFNDVKYNSNYGYQYGYHGYYEERGSTTKLMSLIQKIVLGIKKL